MNKEIKNQLKIQEESAINYIENDLIANHSDFQAQGFWQAIILDFLKKQALIFCGQALIHLKKQAIQWAIDLTAWLLTNLEEHLVTLYNNSNQEEKELFLYKIKENFPDSNLLKKITQI